MTTAMMMMFFGGMFVATGICMVVFEPNHKPANSLRDIIQSDDRGNMMGFKESDDIPSYDQHGEEIAPNLKTYSLKGAQSVKGGIAVNHGSVKIDDKGYISIPPREELQEDKWVTLETPDITKDWPAPNLDDVVMLKLSELQAITGDWEIKSFFPQIPSIYWHNKITDEYSYNGTILPPYVK